MGGQCFVEAPIPYPSGRQTLFEGFFTSELIFSHSCEFDRIRDGADGDGGAAQADHSVEREEHHQHRPGGRSGVET